ncbi:glucokinase [Ramlibacter monticola]|uniref:ROK family protein n=1 Tax=Ramlibacter monticola TaxID=1926872 RepID=A0A936Z128_9BURK|nr:ROK family protein [Ramlibacter monticola]MBL0392960.1 ROK family protein [Ramlibacter monticola]
MKACVDIGGTKIAVSLNDGAGLDLVGKRAEPTAKTGRNDVVAQQVMRMVDQACADVGVNASHVQRVGVSSAGPFVLNAGLVELASPNICGGIAGPARGLPNDWLTATLEAPLRHRFTEGVRVENDAVAALEAERRWGALQGYENCAYVTWSTGVGMGLCVDGRVLRGKNGNAGHGGHMFVSDNDDALCGCGNIGDLEALVAGNAVARRFGADAATLMQRVHAGDPAAVATVDETCRIMGRALYNITVILDLQRISLGGSVFLNHQAYLLPRLQAQLAGKLPALTNGCELVPAGLAGRVGDYAALALLV